MSSQQIHYITSPASDDCGKLTTGVAIKSCLARKAFVAQNSVLRETFCAMNIVNTRRAGVAIIDIMAEIIWLSPIIPNTESTSPRYMALT